VFPEEREEESAGKRLTEAPAVITPTPYAVAASVPATKMVKAFWSTQPRRVTALQRLPPTSTPHEELSILLASTGLLAPFSGRNITDLAYVFHCPHLGWAAGHRS
jgi:hypothetical protein